MSNQLLVKMLQAGENGSEILAILDQLSNTVTPSTSPEDEDMEDEDMEDEDIEEEEDSEQFANRLIPTSDFIEF
jgi:hypothetical protein